MNIYEKRIVLQIGHLQELWRDARSTKHKIMKTNLWKLVPKRLGSLPLLLLMRTHTSVFLTAMIAKFL